MSGVFGCGVGFNVSLGIGGLQKFGGWGVRKRLGF